MCNSIRGLAGRFAWVAIVMALALPVVSCKGSADSSKDAAATASATVHWTAPTTRIDGSALSLSQIAGYVIYAGTSPDDLSRVATIDDGSSTEHTVNGLTSDVYYFAVSAVDVDGLEGPHSQLVSSAVP